MIRVGTSGYNYPEWKGKFYPEKFSSARMLPYYAERFGTVEINASFYRMPTPKVLAGWAAQVPESFVFALKAPKRITHERRLKECEPDVQFFVESAATLGHRLGPLLFQLPPNLKCDLARFDTFLGWLPRDLRIAFEFRNDSWFDPEAVRAAARPQPRPVPGRQRRAAPAARGHGRVRIPAPARRGLRRARPGDVGRPGQDAGSVGRDLRVFQARGRGPGPGVRPPVHRTARVGRATCVRHITGTRRPGGRSSRRRWFRPSSHRNRPSARPRRRSGHHAP